MNFSIVLTVLSLISFSYSVPIDNAPVKISHYAHQQMACTADILDSLVVEYKCKNIWETYRQRFMEAIIEFEDCDDFIHNIRRHRGASFNSDSSSDTILETEVDEWLEYDQ